MSITVRPARPADVRAINRLVEPMTHEGILLGKDLVAYYEAVQEFLVAVDASDEIVGCGALHVMWEDLAEVRTLAVHPDQRGTGIGHRMLTALLARAAQLGLRRVFCLTFEVDFFSRHGFSVMDQDVVDAEVYNQLLRSADEGVAEFLDLARVKPNTLGNTRMIIQLDAEDTSAQGS
ncbi:MAG TPA: amino-acid N-acetyltransferase [Candidatus Brachybacterium merdavium]|uniref:Amino-acid N-acetyltransferase n=1 Tax=Candidatus Brachybacterium merdavium TaxID=2838513 RepID=A0A9D2LFX9_9MICO|nr:amino-acid N-acetyltransferase [Candidatus Brachybacterium merdavium]